MLSLANSLFKIFCQKVIKFRVLNFHKIFAPKRISLPTEILSLVGELAPHLSSGYAPKFGQSSMLLISQLHSSHTDFQQPLICNIFRKTANITTSINSTLTCTSEISSKRETKDYWKHIAMNLVGTWPSAITHLKVLSSSKNSKVI